MNYSEKDFTIKLKNISEYLINSGFHSKEIYNEYNSWIKTYDPLEKENSLLILLSFLKPEHLMKDFIDDTFIEKIAKIKGINFTQIKLILVVESNIIDSKISISLLIKNKETIESNDTIHLDLDFLKEVWNIEKSSTDFINLLKNYTSLLIEESQDDYLTKDYENFYIFNENLMDLVFLNCIYLFKSIGHEKKYTNELIRILFGRYSIIYLIFIAILNQNYKKNKYFFEDQIVLWEKYFQDIYNIEELTKNLYFTHSYLSLISSFIMFKSHYNLKKKIEGFNEQKFTDLINYFKSINFELYEKNPFDWIYKDEKLINILNIFFPILELSKDDLFGLLYQDLISISTRHALGEFYTPRSLVSLMIEKKVKKSKKFLDPACGSGSFLLEILKQILKTKDNVMKNYSIYGIDINPLALQVSFYNLLIYLERHNRNIINFSNPEIRLFLDNALTPSKITQKHIGCVDIVIGNPPWVNISSLYSKKSKILMKSLLEEQGLLYGKESKNSEICTLFFYRCRDLYLANNKEIFFIMPASVLNAKQHVYFRYFKNFSNIEVWQFDDDIFRIHSNCIYAKNKPDGRDFTKKDDVDRLKLLQIEFKVIKVNNKISFKYVNKSQLEPLYIKWDKNNVNFPKVGRFNTIKSSKYPSINPKKSYYYKHVKGGIRFVPRRWIVIKNKPPFSKLTEIFPDLKQQSKSNWSKPPYTKMIVEKESIKPFYKSKNLVPFMLLNINYAFFPCTSEKTSSDSFFQINKMGKNSKELYTLLDSEFRKKIKKSASMKTLEDNFTYNGRLIPSNLVYNPDKEIMVVHNSIGSIVKGAIVRNQILIDNSLYYFITQNEDEAYYLLGVLNSPFMTYNLEKIGSTGSRGSLRNIHKNPYNFPIPKYIKNNSNLSIAQKAREIETIVKKFYDIKISESIKKNTGLSMEENIYIKPRSFQNGIFRSQKFRKELEELDSLILKLFEL